MTVKTRDGRIIVDTIWPDGQRTRRQCVGESQARKLDLRIRASRLDGTWRELREKLNFDRTDKEFTLEDGCKLYLEEYVKINNRSLRSKKSRLDIIQRIIGTCPLSQIGPSSAAKYATKRKADGLSNRTINRDLAVLRHMTSWCVRQGYLREDPLRHYQRLREEDYQGRRPTDEAIEAVLAELDPTVRPLFEFIRETGCRREEALSLKRWQIDARRQVVTFGRTKSGKSRQVPLTERALKAINAMPATGRTEYVFYHPASLHRWSEARGPWEAAREAAGYPWLRIHDLRHAYAIRLAEAGVPMHFISEVLGHQSIDFTRKQYAKFSPESASRAVLMALEGGISQAKSGKKVATAKSGGKRKRL